MSLLSTNYSITSGFALGFACVCESTDLFKALKIVHESSSTKLILRMLERQQLQIYLALYLAAKYILCSTVCVHQLQTAKLPLQAMPTFSNRQYCSPFLCPVQSGPVQSPGFVLSPFLKYLSNAIITNAQHRVDTCSESHP